MIKQKNILSGIAIFIALYMTAALGWWTYSLLKYNRAESDLQLRSLEIQKELCIEKFINKHTKKPSEITSTFLAYYYKDTNFSYLIKNAFSHANYYNMDVQVDESHRNHNIHVIKIGFTPKKKTVLQIQKKLQSKQNAWLGEGIAAGLITLIIIALMYFYLEKILKFNQQTANFMMAVTHELKTPIATTRLTLETLQKRKLDEIQQQKLLTNALSETNRLNILTNNILLAAQMEEKKFRRENEPLLLTNLANSIVNDYRNRYPKRTIECRIEEGIYLNGDELLIQIALSNLIDNAIKYSPTQTPVVIDLIQSNQYIELKVTDSGPGIKDAEKKLIFQKFYRSGDETTRKTKGTGLGLYLTRKIIEHHNGDIFVIDHKPHGSIFVIRLTEGTKN
jgi:signal transduction histidine kinase